MGGATPQDACSKITRVEEPTVLLPSFAEIVSVFYRMISAIYPTFQRTSLAFIKHDMPLLHRVSRWRATSRSTNPIRLVNGQSTVSFATTVVRLRGLQRIPYPSQLLAQLKHDLSDLSNVVELPANNVDTAAKLFHDATPILMCHDMV
jgi:hypothetical protein